MPTTPAPASKRAFLTFTRCDSGIYAECDGTKREVIKKSSSFEYYVPSDSGEVILRNLANVPGYENKNPLELLSLFKYDCWGDHPLLEKTYTISPNKSIIVEEESTTRVKKLVNNDIIEFSLYIPNYSIRENLSAIVDCAVLISLNAK